MGPTTAMNNCALSQSGHLAPSIRTVSRFGNYRSPTQASFQSSVSNLQQGLPGEVRRQGGMSTTHCGPVKVTAMARDSPPILINGAQGKMGIAVAEAALRAGVPLLPLAITGPRMAPATLTHHVAGSEESVEVKVFPAEERDRVMDEALALAPNLIVVDYTLPSAVHDNADWYCSRGVPFVMGTTGGDRVRLLADVERAGVYAVIAPQMGKQVVAFIAALDHIADTCPGAFSGYSMQAIESHQSTKVDTSGTAKEVVAAFQRLGVQFSVEEIEKVRDPQQQQELMHVPAEYLNGHAFHTYKLRSPDNTVSFEYQHNVCGRSIYADGAIDAVLFLASRIKEKDLKTLYNMMDVLKAGAMR